MTGTSISLPSESGQQPAIEQRSIWPKVWGTGVVTAAAFAFLAVVGSLASTGRDSYDPMISALIWIPIIGGAAVRCLGGRVAGLCWPLFGSIAGAAGIIIGDGGAGEGYAILVAAFTVVLLPIPCTIGYAAGEALAWLWRLGTE